jgi:hypothetical protein
VNRKMAKPNHPMVLHIAWQAPRLMFFAARSSVRTTQHRTSRRHSAMCLRFTSSHPRTGASSPTTRAFVHHPTPRLLLPCRRCLRCLTHPLTHSPTPSLALWLAVLQRDCGRWASHHRVQGHQDQL